MSFPTAERVRPLVLVLVAALVAVALPALPASADGLGLPVGRLHARAVLPLDKPAIITDLADATVNRYGKKTSVTFRVSVAGTKLHYRWQYHSASGPTWRTIAKATSSSYKATAVAWSSGTRFRVTITGSGGTVTSRTAKLTVAHPTKTPAKDAAKAFGLTGLRQGVDLSAWEYVPGARVRLKAIRSWTGSNGFTILRNGTGARPVKQKYTDLCTAATKKTGSTPVLRDCAYARLADAATASKLSLGHYWFNGWISTIDTTPGHLFAAGYTPKRSAAQFVRWLIHDGDYTKKSTDPLVLDVEKGAAWTKTSKGRKYTVSLRAWKPDEAADFLAETSRLLTQRGYHANLYVYMSVNVATATAADGSYAWAPVAALARLWIASWDQNNGRIPAAQPLVGPWQDYGGWSIWQYSDNVRISADGVGAVDGDVAKPDAWKVR